MSNDGGGGTKTTDESYLSDRVKSQLSLHLELSFQGQPQKTNTITDRFLN